MALRSGDRWILFGVSGLALITAAIWWVQKRPRVEATARAPEASAPLLGSARSEASAAIAPRALPSASPAEPPPDPALLAEIEGTRAELVALRSRALAPDASVTDGCARFSSVDLATAKALRAQLGPGSASNECSAEALEKVRCLDTPDGYFVPVADRRSSAMCAYRLWFVPRQAAGGAPVPVSDSWEEFDIQFTTRMVAEDLDADGVVEAVVARGYAHPEGVGEWVTLYLIDPTGEQSILPFSDMVAGDPTLGLDAVLSFDTTVNAAGCEPPDHFEAWVASSISAPSLLLQRVAANRFSLQAPRSRAARVEACAELGGALVARGPDGLVDEQETLRRNVCRLAEGEEPAAVREALQQACTRDYEIPADCTKRRSGVCFWKSTLLGVPDTFDKLKPWLEAPSRLPAPSSSASAGASAPTSAGAVATGR
jgi:hypothetical protein